MRDYYDVREEYPLTADDIEDALFFVDAMEEWEMKEEYYAYEEMN